MNSLETLPVSTENAANIFNISQYLPAMAQSAPERPAVICRHSPDSLGRTTLTFAELNTDSDQLAHGLFNAGIRPGERALLMVHPGLDFISLTFALFKLGAVPVLIDPGMGRKNLLNCIRQARPEAMIAVPLAHVLKFFSADNAFSSLHTEVTVGTRWFWGGPSLSHVRGYGKLCGAFKIAPTRRDSPAAILFTTGSTGTPKGVLYRHGMFGAQVQAIKDQYGIEPGEVDLPAFPLFALFSTALGTTCVIPDMDPTRPAECDPEKIVRAIQENKVTYTFGSPSIWKRVGAYCLSQKTTLPTLKRILMAGAPVRGDVLEPFAKILGEGADTHIPYGATEALPVTSIRGSEVLNETWALTRKGKGYCVGKPLPGVTVKTIALFNRPRKPGRQNWDPARVLPAGEIGEIVVKGNVVTQEYFEVPHATESAKMYEPDGSVWHRMGDVGYFDDTGRLWFCGRKAHRVLMDGGRILYSVCVEAIVEEACERICGAKTRAALVGFGPIGQQVPAIVIEHDEEALPKEDELREWLGNHDMTRDISGMLYHPGFPVDIRHNAKIDREKLARWAEKEL